MGMKDHLTQLLNYQRRIADMDKTHWKKLENPDYLGAYALQPNKDLVVQIKSVGQEEVYNPTNNKKETMHFV